MAEEESSIPMHTDEPIEPLNNEDNTMSDPYNGSDSDSDSDSDDEAVKLQIQTLESELNANPGNYDAHVQYISALRKEGELEKLQVARETMSELFPLTPAMWQEWIKDEISISSGSDAFTAVEKLYERGVSDYLSVPLWCDYINFVQEYEPFVRQDSPTNISKLRNLFERALTAAGLHIAEGYKIWETYRNFEQTLLDTMDQTDIESRKKQVQRIRNIFHRQLSVPHTALDVTLIAYKSWEAHQGTSIDLSNSSLDGIAAHTSSAYRKALEMLNTRVHFENLVCNQESTELERLQEYMAYFKFEQTSGDPARVQILYERAITEFPISVDLWLNYTEYLDRTLKAAKTVKDVYYRATRNCPWVKELWVRYLLILERLHASEEDISAVFEKSLNCTFSSLDEYLDIFLTRVDGLRRRISIDGGPNVEYALIRDTFQRASDYLSKLDNTSSFLHMYRYWARLESSLGKDTVAARGVWESLLKSNGSMYEAWQGYISMEIEAGHINNARSLYKRCYNKRLSGTGSEDICHSWIRFEREYGTLQDHLDHAVQKVTPRLAELQLFRLQQDSKYVVGSTDQTDTSTKVKEKKRKQVPSVSGEESLAKRQKGNTQHLNLKKSHNVDKIQLKISDVVVQKEQSEGQVGKAERENVVETKVSGATKSRHYNDQCTAFMSNLHLKATAEDLRNFLSDIGGIGDVRILKDKFTGNSRGLAYVDFSNDKHLVAALKKNKRNFLGKKVSIARSNPKQDRKNGSMKHEKSEPGEPTQIFEGNKDSLLNQGHKEKKVLVKGKNTFIPRNVRPLGYTSNINTNSNGVGEVADEQPKSNDEFRKILFRK